jgi:hypothetical protein
MTDLLSSSEEPVVICTLLESGVERGRNGKGGTNLTGEDTRRYGVHSDFRADESSRQHPAEMRGRRLGAGVRELAAGGALHVAGDTADVDDLGGVTRGNTAALGQQWQEGHGHVEDAADVGLHGSSPVLGLRLEEVV